MCVTHTCMLTDVHSFFMLVHLLSISLIVEYSNLVLQPETVIDMKQRYVGHCNVGTDIKQASFLGQRG